MQTTAETVTFDWTDNDPTTLFLASSTRVVTASTHVADDPEVTVTTHVTARLIRLDALGEEDQCLTRPEHHDADDLVHGFYFHGEQVPEGHAVRFGVEHMALGTRLNTTWTNDMYTNDSHITTLAGARREVMTRAMDPSVDFAMFGHLHCTLLSLSTAATV